MKIRYADSTGCPVGQFVVEAENDQERIILNSFCSFPSYAKDEWIFWKHGDVMEGNKNGISSFNFGWVLKKKMMPDADAQ